MPNNAMCKEDNDENFTTKWYCCDFDFCNVQRIISVPRGENNSIESEKKML